MVTRSANSALQSHNLVTTHLCHTPLVTHFTTPGKHNIHTLVLFKITSKLEIQSVVSIEEDLEAGILCAPTPYMRMLIHRLPSLSVSCECLTMEVINNLNDLAKMKCPLLNYTFKGSLRAMSSVRG